MSMSQNSRQRLIYLELLPLVSPQCSLLQGEAHSLPACHRRTQFCEAKSWYHRCFFHCITSSHPVVHPVLCIVAPKCSSACLHSSTHNVKNSCRLSHLDRSHPSLGLQLPLPPFNLFWKPEFLKVPTWAISFPAYTGKISCCSLGGHWKSHMPTHSTLAGLSHPGAQLGLSHPDLSFRTKILSLTQLLSGSSEPSLLGLKPAL